MARVEDSSPRPTNMSDTLEHLMQQTLGENPLRPGDVNLRGKADYTFMSAKSHFFYVFPAVHLPSFLFLFVSAVAPPVAGQTSDFVNKILDNTGRGDPTGGLVGLRVPTSKI